MRTVGKKVLEIAYTKQDIFLEWPPGIWYKHYMFQSEF